jgi:hypothetical protein
MASKVSSVSVVGLILTAFLMMSVFSNNAYAYRDHRDRPEYVEIQPNQSAFLIPLAGANKKTQGKFMSEQYLSENKVATKRIQIPHVLIRNPTLERDFYVPAAKLIIVDRTPYNREWVKSKTKGTSARDESFDFESNESINISTGVVAAAFVREEDSAKFLYWWGTKTDAQEIFASVANGRSLADVMDNVVRNRVQALLAREFGKLSLIDGIKNKSKTMETIEAEAKKEFAEKGITIQFIGYAEGLTLDPTVQVAINEVFEANTKVKAYDALNKMMPIYQQQADIAIKKGVAKSAGNWNGSLNLPNWVILPADIAGHVTGWFKGLLNGKPGAQPTTQPGITKK